MKVLLIPDTQVKPNVPTNHLTALGNYIVKKKPDVIVHIGDHWDMPSLNSYDKKGSKSFEGRRVKEDITSGNEAMDLLLAPMKAYNKKQKKTRHKQYKPRMVFCMGNHEYRIKRATDSDPSLEGLIGYDMLNLKDWEVHEFLEIVNIEDVLFSHYFINTLSLTKGVLAGTIDNKLQKVGNSFVMGHQQTLQFGTHYLNDGTAHIGLVAGAFYQHHEDYMGLQGNHHWRGAVMLNQLQEGKFDPMFLSMDYLLKEQL
ncbi:MAG: hypothetical protein GQ474_07915 [Sulfurimonas sp.]|nr:hypothetical protein [Sulfurimonas sp.]